MVFKFRPVDGSFYDLFAASGHHLVAGAALLSESLADGVDRESIARRMRDAETAADATTHELVRRANSTFVTPFDREDIYALATELDDVMDLLEEAVDMIALYDVKVLPSELTQQASVIQRCAELTAEAMPRLRAMRDLSEYWTEINRLERAGDKSYRRILAKLFGGDFKAMEVLKLKDISETLEKAIDGFESVANTVEQIAVKES